MRNRQLKEAEIADLISPRYRTATSADRLLFTAAGFILFNMLKVRRGEIPTYGKKPVFWKMKNVYS